MSGQLDPGPSCFLCGAVAAGRCAGCHAFTCGDCCDVRTGATGPIAYCVRCIREGAHHRHWAALGRVLLWLGVFATLLFGVSRLIVG